MPINSEALRLRAFLKDFFSSSPDFNDSNADGMQNLKWFAGGLHGHGRNFTVEEVRAALDEAGFPDIHVRMSGYDCRGGLKITVEAPKVRESKDDTHEICTSARALIAKPLF